MDASGILSRLVCLALLALYGLSVAALDWTQTSTPHFRVLSDGDPARVRALAVDLERFRFVTQRLLKLDDDDRPIVLVAASGSGTYRDFVGKSLSRSTVGLFTSSGYGNYAVLKLDGYVAEAGSQIDQARETLLHEYTHYLTFARSAQRLPYWYQEGIAEFLSSMTFPDGKQFTVGAIPLQIRYYLDYRPGVLPLDELLRATPADSGMKRSWDVYVGGWILTHWLLMSSGRGAAIDDYLIAWNRGEDPVSAAEKAFGSDVAKLRFAYSNQSYRGYPNVTNPLPAGFQDPEARTEAADDSLVRTTLARFLQATAAGVAGPGVGRAQELAELLAEAETRDAPVDGIAASLAGVLLQRREIELASDVLARVPPPQRTSTSFRNARAWLEFERLRVSGEASPDLLRPIRQAFVDLVNEDPDVASNWFGLARTMRAMGYPLGKYMEFLEQAWLRAPQDLSIAYGMALALGERGDVEAARVAGGVLSMLDDLAARYPDSALGVVGHDVSLSQAREAMARQAASGN